MSIIIWDFPRSQKFVEPGLMSIYSYTFDFDTFKNDTFKSVIFRYSQK